MVGLRSVRFLDDLCAVHNDYRRCLALFACVLRRFGYSCVRGKPVFIRLALVSRHCRIVWSNSVRTRNGLNSLVAARVVLLY